MREAFVFLLTPYLGPGLTCVPMQLQKHIRGLLAATFTALVLVLLPMANVVSAHACCPEDSESAVAASAATAAMHARMGHTVPQDTLSPDGMSHNHMQDGSCDAACCGNFAAFYLGDQQPQARAYWPGLVRSHTPRRQWVSAALGHTTPPPRTV